MNNKNVKRVIHVVSDMHRGGAETMIMNLYRNIDRSKLQFDFICHYRKDDANSLNKNVDYYDEINQLGGRIFKIPSLGTSNPIEYMKNIKNILNQNGPFEAVHVHTNKQAGFALLAARLSKVRNRIIHSHITEWNYRNKIYSTILKNLIKINSTKYCTCGEEAAINAFGEKAFKNGKVFLLNNAIEVDNFINVEYESVEKIREEFNINNEDTIIGHVGRFDTQKNHKFIIELAKRFKSNKRNFIMLLAGNGPIKNEIKELVNKDGLSENIKFIGVRKDINLLMSMIDVFILPSLFEGLPLVGIEAQAAGTKCIISDTVTSEIDMGLGLMKQLPITSESIESWEEEIFNKNIIKIEKNKILEALTVRGYNVKTNVYKLYKLYGLKD